MINEWAVKNCPYSTVEHEVGIGLVRNLYNFTESICQRCTYYQISI